MVSALIFSTNVEGNSILEWHKQQQSRVPSFCDEAQKIKAIWINAKKHIFAIMINCNTAEINVAKNGMETVGCVLRVFECGMFVAYER